MLAEKDLSSLYVKMVFDADKPKVLYVGWSFSLICAAATSPPALANAFSEVTVKTSVKRDESIIKQEAYVSIGTISCVGLFGGLTSSIADSIAEANKKNNRNEEEEPFEAFSIGLGYNLFLIDFIGLGGFLNFEKFGQLDFVSAQAKLSIQYGWKHFKFYHSASGGVLFISDSAVCPVFDFTVLGLKIDLDDCNIFLEGSFPSTAFLKLGCSYYF